MERKNLALVRRRMKVRRALVHLAGDPNTSHEQLAQIDRVLGHEGMLGKFADLVDQKQATLAASPNGRPIMDLFQFIVDNRAAIFEIILQVIKLFA